MSIYRFYCRKTGQPWEDITELEVHAKLYTRVRQTTPIIRLLLRGHIYHLPESDEWIKLVAVDPC